MYVTLDILIFEGEVSECSSLWCRRLKLSLDECQKLSTPRGPLYAYGSYRAPESDADPAGGYHETRITFFLDGNESRL